MVKPGEVREGVLADLQTCHFIYKRFTLIDFQYISGFQFIGERDERIVVIYSATKLTFDLIFYPSRIF